MLLPLLATLLPDTQAQTFMWEDGKAKYYIQCTIDRSHNPATLRTVFYQDGSSQWTTTTEFQDPQPDPTKFIALPSATGRSDRLILIEVPRENWTDAYLLLATPKSHPNYQFSYRASHSDVLSFARNRQNQVVSFTAYDLYITGPHLNIYQRGELIDRWEQVQTYNLAQADDFKVAKTRYRLVPVTGGGIGETNFQWRTDWKPKR